MTAQRQPESALAVAGAPARTALGVDEVELMQRVEDLMQDLVLPEVDDVCGLMAAEHLSTGGKRLRARLALRATAALGGDPDGCVPWAAAVELMHNASLIHDDLQDGDDMRRGVPALWARHGQAQAINAGDLLLMMPTLALSRIDTDDATRWRLAECVARNGASTARGQSEELALRTQGRVDRDAYMRAASGKTAGLFGMPVEGAALLAGCTPGARHGPWPSPFRHLG